MGQEYNKTPPYKPFDAFAKEFLAQELGAVGDVVSAALRVAPEQYIDVQFTRTKAGETRLRLLGELAGEGSLWEPFSTTPSAQHIRDNVEKHLAFDRDTRAERGSKPWDAPRHRLWIIAPYLTDPKAKFKELKELAPTLKVLGFEPDTKRGPGFWSMAEGLNVGLIVVDQLPATEDTLWLRLLGRDPTLKEAVGQLRERIQQGHARDKRTLELLLRWGIYHKTLGLDDPWLQEIMMHMTTEQFFQMARRQFIRELDLEELLEIHPEIAQALKPQIVEEVRPQIVEEMRPQIAEEMRPQITEEVRPQIVEEMRPQIVEEMRPQIVEEMRPALTLEAAQRERGLLLQVALEESLGRVLAPEERALVEARAAGVDERQLVRWVGASVDPGKREGLLRELGLEGSTGQGQP